MAASKKSGVINYVPKVVTLDCPVCSAVVGAPVLGSYAYLEEGPDVPTRFLFARCPNCDRPMVAVQENWGDWNNDHHFDKPRRYLPANSRLGATVPRAVVAAFNEAGRCYGAQAYAAATIMARKAIESLVKEHKIRRANLASGLRAMKDQGLIEARLFEWADSLRLVGNAAAHEPLEGITKEDARDTLDFTAALIEYVFTYRDRFEEFKARRAGKKLKPK